MPSEAGQAFSCDARGRSGVEAVASRRPRRDRAPLGLKSSDKTEGTLSEELDRAASIETGDAMSKRPHDRLFVIFETYLEQH